MECVYNGAGEFMNITRTELYVIRQALEVALIQLNKTPWKVPLSKATLESTIDKLDILADYCGSCDSIGIV